MTTGFDGKSLFYNFKTDQWVSSSPELHKNSPPCSPIGGSRLHHIPAIFHSIQYTALSFLFLACLELFSVRYFAA
jgi:hypothetical protein